MHERYTKAAGMVLIQGSLAGFFTGGFSSTQDRTAAKIGPLDDGERKRARQMPGEQSCR